MEKVVKDCVINYARVHSRHIFQYIPFDSVGVFISGARIIKGPYGYFTWGEFVINPPNLYTLSERKFREIEWIINEDKLFDRPASAFSGIDNLSAHEWGIFTDTGLIKEIPQADYYFVKDFVITFEGINLPNCSISAADIVAQYQIIRCLPCV